MESVKKPGKDGESTGKAEPEKAPWKPIEPGMVEPTEAHKTLEVAGWKATTKGITTNSYEHPDHPGHVIGLTSARWRPVRAPRHPNQPPGCPVVAACYRGGGGTTGHGVGSGGA